MLSFDDWCPLLQGISLLELKNQTFLSYLANLTYVTLAKLSGRKIEGSACVGKLREKESECNLHLLLYLLWHKNEREILSALGL